MKNSAASTIKLLVCTDIFGETPALLNWLAPLGADLFILSPYQSRYEFNDDQSAYQFFCQQGGLNAYTQKLAQYLAQHPQPCAVLGFSAGAAVLWSALGTCCENAALQMQLRQAWLFYGGQIRLQPQLQPRCNTQLIWAQEHHFDVEALHLQLASTTLVKSELTPYQHGFLNPASAGFDPDAARYYQGWLMQQLTTIGQ